MADYPKTFTVTVASAEHEARVIAEVARVNPSGYVHQEYPKFVPALGLIVTDAAHHARVAGAVVAPVGGRPPKPVPQRLG